MDEEPNVSEIICADYDEKAVNELVKILKKAKGIKVDANDVDSIVAAAEGCDLIVNALPIAYAPNVLDAALEVNVTTRTSQQQTYWTNGGQHAYRCCTITTVINSKKSARWRSSVQVPHLV